MPGPPSVDETAPLLSMPFAPPLARCSRASSTLSLCTWSSRNRTYSSPLPLAMAGSTPVPSLNPKSGRCGHSQPYMYTRTHFFKKCLLFWSHPHTNTLVVCAADRRGFVPTDVLSNARVNLKRRQPDDHRRNQRNPTPTTRTQRRERPCICSLFNQVKSTTKSPGGRLATRDMVTQCYSQYSVQRVVVLGQMNRTEPAP
jgi:hypothetical protein